MLFNTKLQLWSWRIPPQKKAFKTEDLVYRCGPYWIRFNFREAKSLKDCFA